MDLDYVSYGVIMGVLGVVGLTATASTSPNIFAIATCNCIPSPLERLQMLSVILIAFAAVFVPLSTTRRTSESATRPVHWVLPSGRTYTDPPMRSGEMFALGAALIVIGTAVVVPSLMIAFSLPLTVEGFAIAGLGIFLAQRGGKAKSGRA